MILDELFTAMTHVATQLTGRWFPIPNVSGSIAVGCDLTAVRQFANGGYSSVTQDGWYEILEIDASSYVPALTWLDVLLRKNKMTLTKLSEAAYRHFQESSSYQAETISIHSSDYPSLLRWIAKPPLLITALGNLNLLQRRCIGVIGSRKASYESLRTSVETGISLAKTDWGVISGGAIGCDIAVHEGMLASGVNEVAAIVVFAGGLHDRFPRCNERAFKEILSRGGLFISERLWFQDVLPRDFPARNRIVSGISQAVAVMAAAVRSGSLITAQEALEQGRDVYVFDCDSGEADVRFEGSRQLIDDGAFPFLDSGHLLEYLKDGYDAFPEVSLGHTRGTCQVASSIGTFKTEPFIH